MVSCSISLSLSFSVKWILMANTAQNYYYLHNDYWVCLNSHSAIHFLGKELSVWNASLLLCKELKFKMQFFLFPAKVCLEVLTTLFNVKVTLQSLEKPVSVALTYMIWHAIFICTSIVGQVLSSLSWCISYYSYSSWSVWTVKYHLFLLCLDEGEIMLSCFLAFWRVWPKPRVKDSRQMKSVLFSWIRIKSSLSRFWTTHNFGTAAAGICRNQLNRQFVSLREYFKC